MEQIPCPRCQGELQPYDRRNRKYKDEQGDWKILVIRRLRCRNPLCRRIHAELPDILVPYKRYAVDVITTVLTGIAIVAPTEESTRYRWKYWYRQIRDHLLGVEASVRRNLQEINRTLLASPSRKSTFHVMELAVLNLSELVRLAVNTGNWTTTRSAMVTGPLAL
ncbi:MAG: DUF6431 domain-containing protein [Saccharofermentanales bacterium]|jgi:hypothetical protein